MNRLSSLQVRLAVIVLFAVALPVGLMAYTHDRLTWLGFALGLLSLGAAWFAGELFVRRQVSALIAAAKNLAAGNLAARTGLQHDKSELGDLARSLDSMAEALDQQLKERERSEQSLINRAYQQTVIAALGQFALVATDLPTLLNQAVMLIGQTLGVEYVVILEAEAEGQIMTLRAGTGWKDGFVGRSMAGTERESQASHTLKTGEPALVSDSRGDVRFEMPEWMREHGVAAGVTVAIQGHNRGFGVLAAHTTAPREFTEQEMYFMAAAASLIALAVERQRTEPEIQKLAAFAKYNPSPVLEFSADGRLTYFNDATQRMTVQLEQKHPAKILPPETADIVANCLATGQSRLQLETRPGARVLSWSFFPIMASQVVHCYVEDITERLSLEEQFRQAQKMESVGHLAAGVAHDFNNILTIIQGHSELLMAKPNLPAAMTASIQAVSFAAERAAGLTRQLLLFSRKQDFQPKLLDLKDVVANLAKMLQRLVGETITLKCESVPKLPPVTGDAGMMEQIIMNLAVNARDAMPRGGELLISTAPATIDDAYAKHHPNARPGSFVCLQVKDSGSGMDATTMKRIFEPFFTTKEAGKGTGLGLATVYGIAKQHSGWVEVNSSVGHGSAFKIYLPAAEKPVESQANAAPPSAPVRGGTETVLVVEDEPVLRDLALLMLQDCGYKVLEASSGVDALNVWQRHDKRIDLLLTDMIMPDGLTGRDLAEVLVSHKPNLKVIFTSGYSIEDMGGESGGKRGPMFLQKPYSRFTLAKAVRDCLDN